MTILSTNVDPQPELFGPLDERTAKRKAVAENVHVKPQPRTQDLSVGKTLAAAGHMI